MIAGDSAKHVFTTAFAKRLEDRGVGALSTPIPEDDRADHDAEKFEMHLSLHKASVDDAPSRD